MAPNSLCSKARSAMPVIDLSWKKRQHAYVVSAAAHEPIPSPIADVLVICWDKYDWCNSSDALTNWANARWKKTGYSVSRETVCFMLRLRGRNAKMGIDDHLQGAFYRGELQV